MPLAQSFVAEKEEGLVLAFIAARRAPFAKTRQVDRSANVESELVTLERRGTRGAIEEVAGLELLVAEILKKLAMVFIGSRPSGDVYDRAGVASVFSAVC